MRWRNSRKPGVKPTDDQPKYSARADPGEGHGDLERRRSGTLAAPTSSKTKQLAIILDRTNFYAEMGGQVGDAGELRSAGGAIVRRRNHHAPSAATSCTSADSRSGKLQRRRHRHRHRRTAAATRTEKNHTTTHLANWALREVLGDDVQQKGSLVDPEKLRFDFSHGKALSDEELARSKRW